MCLDRDLGFYCGPLNIGGPVADCEPYVLIFHQLFVNFGHLNWYIFLVISVPDGNHNGLATIELQDSSESYFMTFQGLKGLLALNVPYMGKMLEDGKNVQSLVEIVLDVLLYNF